MGHALGITFHADKHSVGVKTPGGDVPISGGGFANSGGGVRRNCICVAGSPVGTPISTGGVPNSGGGVGTHFRGRIVSFRGRCRSAISIDSSYDPSTLPEYAADMIELFEDAIIELNDGDPDHEVLGTKIETARHLLDGYRDLAGIE